MRKKKVLVIDDSPEMVLLVSKVLGLMGLEVLCANDGPSGAALAAAQLPDLIVLDFNMPGENGVETYARLKSAPATAVIPVIFLSAIMTGLIKRMVVENPRVRFLKKPCQRKELENCVLEMLALPALAPPPAPPPRKKTGFEQYE